MPDYHTLTFRPPPVDIDDDGQTEQLVFEFSHSMRQEYETITDYLGKGGSNIIAVLSDLVDSGLLDGGNNQQFAVTLGGGEHVVSISAEVQQGSPNRWGTGDGDGVTDKTGGHPVAQLQLLDRVLQQTKIDSTNPATVEVGEYSSSGQYEPIRVVPENPNGIFDAETETSSATIDIRFVEIATLLQPIDAQERGAD